MMIFRTCAVFAAFFLSLPTASEAQSNGGNSAVTVTVAPEESGNWSVVYSFEEPQAVLAFARSSNDYREATWTLETDEARFGRVAGVDVIVFDDEVREAKFSIIPLTSSLEADYTPFVAFTDGSLAIYEGQFSLIPFDSLDDVEALEGDLEASDRDPIAMTIKVASDKKIIVDGKIAGSRLSHAIKGDGTYIYMGDSNIEPFDSFVAVLDKTLPAWLGERFDDDLEQIFSEFERRWGFKLKNKATVMLAYKGGQGQKLSATGGALDQLLMMEVGGAALNSEDPDTLSYLKWFFAHEAVHLFQSEKGIQFSDDESAWIHEGAANTMSYSLIAASMGERGEQFLASVYSNAFDSCAAALAKGSLETVSKRGDFSANYACGDFIALATDGFLKRRTLYEFWDSLVDSAVSMEEPRIDADLYFTTMQLAGATGAQRRQIRRIVEDKQANPREALTKLLEDADLNPQFSAGGQLISLDWPDYSAE